MTKRSVKAMKRKARHSQLITAPVQSYFWITISLRFLSICAQAALTGRGQKWVSRRLFYVRVCDFLGSKMIFVCVGIVNFKEHLSSWVAPIQYSFTCLQIHQPVFPFSTCTVVDSTPYPSRSLSWADIWCPSRHSLYSAVTCVGLICEGMRIWDVLFRPRILDQIPSSSPCPPITKRCGLWISSQLPWALFLICFHSSLNLALSQFTHTTLFSHLRFSGHHLARGKNHPRRNARHSASMGYGAVIFCFIFPRQSSVQGSP